MSLKNDLMFPFGNPYKERLESHATKTALKNVLKLAKDKMRIVEGEMEELIMMPESADYVNAELSIKQIESLLNYIDGKEEEHTNQT